MKTNDTHTAIGFNVVETTLRVTLKQGKGVKKNDTHTATGFNVTSNGYYPPASDITKDVTRPLVDTPLRVTLKQGKTREKERHAYCNRLQRYK